MSKELQTLTALLILCTWATRCWSGPRVDLRTMWSVAMMGETMPQAARGSIKIGPHGFDFYPGAVIVHHSGPTSSIYALDLKKLRARIGLQFSETLERIKSATGVDLNH